MIGAGVSGLAAAAELVRLSQQGAVPLALSVYEASDRPGGMLLTTEFAGTWVDLGAESLLARGPEAEAVVDSLGLGPRVVRPATTSAAIWTGRKLVAIPRDSVLGVPMYPWRSDVIRAVGVAGAARAAIEPWLGRRAPDPDGALGSFVGGRVGQAVFRRLVDPLLGGVYAGPAQLLSSGAVAPQLVAAARDGGSLIRGLRQNSSTEPRRPATTPFISFQSGLRELTDGLVKLIPEGALKLGRRVASLEPMVGNRVRLQTQGEPAAEFDGLIVALAAPEAAILVNSLNGELTPLLRQLEYASVATVTLAYPDTALPRPLVGSGFLTARRPRRILTACTFLDRKWPHLRQPGLTILRASAGSFGDEWVLALDDTTLVTTIHLELRSILGVIGLPVEVRVERWHGALPQYRAGHLRWRERVAQAAGQAPAPLELTGAAFAGVGVAACLREGAASAGALWDRLNSASS